jgi:hypothetical protein
MASGRIEKVGESTIQRAKQEASDFEVRIYFEAVA